MQLHPSCEGMASWRLYPDLASLDLRGSGAVLLDLPVVVPMSAIAAAAGHAGCHGLLPLFFFREYT